MQGGFFIYTILGLFALRNVLDGQAGTKGWSEEAISACFCLNLDLADYRICLIDCLCKTLHATKQPLECKADMHSP